MGRVYEAINEQIQRRVAIKILHSQFAENPLVVQRFLNEARAVNIVKHRCLVDIYEFGQLEDGSAYIVMEYLDGDTLHERLWKQGGKLPMDMAVRYARQIALALAAAHAKGIIHRDLKPANIMLVEDPETGSHDWIKVLDFGLARVHEPSEGGRLTQTGVVMGTPAYMSPEQVRSARSVVDRSDVYTLGVILYEMLSGQKPFVSSSDAEMMFMHMSTAAPSLSEVAPEMPQALVDLLARMLSKNPAERPAATIVASTLARLVGVATSTAMPVISPDHSKITGSGPIDFADTQPLNTGAVLATVATPGAEVATALAKASLAEPRSRRIYLLIGAVLLLTLAGGGLFLLLHSGHLLEGERVNWTIRSVPSGAQVIGEDGHILGITPFSSQPAKRPGAQTLILRKNGYQEARVTCESNADCERETMLLVPPAPSEPKTPAIARPDAESVKEGSDKNTDGKPAKPEGGKKKSGKKSKKAKTPDSAS